MIAVSEFWKNLATLTGLHGYCKSCARAYYAKMGAEIIRGRNLKRKYHMSLQDWDTLRVSQGDKCALCREPFSTRFMDSKWPYVDHCHVTGKIRGLLCRWCNLTLERSETFPDWPERIRRYLEGGNGHDTGDSNTASVGFLGAERAAVVFGTQPASGPAGTPIDVDAEAHADKG